MSDEPDGLPYPLALIACDHIHVDPVGLSKSLLGVFVHRRAESFPAEIPLYFSFSFIDARKGLAPCRCACGWPRRGTGAPPCSTTAPRWTGPAGWTCASSWSRPG